MTWLIALIAPFIMYPSIPNPRGTCTLDGILLSKLYSSNVNIEEKYWQEASYYISSYRDRVWDDRFGNRRWNHTRDTLDKAQEEWLIKSWRKVDHEDYEFTTWTIADLWQLKYHYKDELVLRKRRWDERWPHWWHVVAIIWDTWEYWMAFSDLWWWINWYVLLTKENRIFYVLEF